MAAPVLEPIANLTIPAGKPLILPLRASDADGDALTYTISSNSGLVATSIKTNNTYLKISVSHQGDGTQADPTFSGDMIFQLFNDVAPEAVAAITQLANQGKYDGKLFHRVIPNFVIQGGSPTGTGVGAIDNLNYKDEFSAQAIFTGNGQLALANATKDNNGSQFFVTVGPQRLLDYNHTIFGQLVRGFEVRDQIRNVPTDGSDAPLSDVVITDASIVTDTTDAVALLQSSGPTGSATVTVTVSDGQGNLDFESFTATVVADSTNDPPFLGPVADQVTTPGTPVTFALTSTDLENDAVDYSVVNNPTGPADIPTNATVTVNGGSVTVTPASTFTGTLQLMARVRQQGATSRGSVSNPYDTEVFTVSVVEQTLTPQGASVAATQRVPFNNQVVASFTAAVPGSALNYEATIVWGDQSQSPGDIVPNGSGGFNVIGGHTYAQDGTFPITVTIHDKVNDKTATANSTATVAGVLDSGASSKVADFDADGKTDIAVFRPGQARWLSLLSGGTVLNTEFGGRDLFDIPAPGDYDGDGKTDLVVFRPSTARWLGLLSGGTVLNTEFGGRDLFDIPAPGDYDGDGKTDLVVFRPSTAQWLGLLSGGTVLSRTFGATGLFDIPAPGDYDGDGKTDVAIFRPSQARWLSVGSSGAVLNRVFGAANLLDIPAPGDYDGDGRTDVAVFRPLTAQFLSVLTTQTGLNRTFGATNLVDVPVTAPIGALHALGRFPRSVSARPAASALDVTTTLATPSPIVGAAGMGRRSDLTSVSLKSRREAVGQASSDTFTLPAWATRPRLSRVAHWSRPFGRVRRFSV